MNPAGFEPAIPASDRPQTLALDRSVTFFVVRAFFSFFRFVLFIHCVPLYPLSSCHLLLYNTNIHAPGET